MGIERMTEPTSQAMQYETPARPARRRIRSTSAMVGGMFLVLIAPLTLIVGFVVINEYRGYTMSDFSVAFAFAVCTFSAACLFAGLPLIYRGTRADD